MKWLVRTAYAVIPICAAWVAIENTFGETVVGTLVVEGPQDLWTSVTTFINANAVPVAISLVALGILAIVALKWALRHGLKLTNGSKPPSESAPVRQAQRWEDGQEAPIEAYAVSRVTLEAVVTAAVKRQVNGEITKVKESVEASRKESREAITKVHERIDTLVNTLIAAGK